MDSLLKLRDVKGIELLMPAHGQCVEEDPYAKVNKSWNILIGNTSRYNSIMTTENLGKIR